ncbi:hypothetical protein A0H81_11785 [Grifola frondosa]|uniref:Uncharacterized protein n=1 Tax=Grifola frondosa TaxID=5627 RepID=A0A1C7LWI4_GRIFR|nr:hypothetical protein A0H81_11785 [Grifola frondosa]
MKFSVVISLPLVLPKRRKQRWLHTRNRNAMHVVPDYRNHVIRKDALWTAAMGHRKFTHRSLLFLMSVTVRFLRM